MRSPSAPPAAERTDERPADASNTKPKVARKRPPVRGESSPKGSSVRQEPFSGYDHLGSAAVVARLGELSKAERAVVRAYETANRNRRTVLGRLDQLDPSR